MESAPLPGAPMPPPAGAGRTSWWRLDERRITRITLACMMILVAAFGAATAYWIAVVEQKSSRQQRQLTRGQMVEISLRQAIVGDWGFRAILEERQRVHQSRAANLEDNSNRARQADPQQAGQLDMLAQQELTLSRLTGTLLAAFRVRGSDDTGQQQTVQQQVDARVTGELAQLGFATAAPQTSNAGTDATPQSGEAKALTYDSVISARQLPVWRRLTSDIKDLHHHVPLLALGVVLFISALVCLTAADLVRDAHVMSNTAILLGTLATVGALWCVVKWDPSVLWPLFVVTSACTLVGVAFWKLGMFSAAAEGDTPHPPELEPRQFLGGHIFLRRAHGARDRAVVMMIAITVLLSSVVGFWYAGAETNATEATDQAFASEVALNNLNGERWLLASADGITPSLELFSARMRCAFASQVAVLPPADANATTIALLARDRERDCQALDTDKYQGSARIVDDLADFDSGDGPAGKIFSEIRNRGPANPSHLYALADGYISLAERWEAKSSMYILGLTLFAIALYLLSQSLGMGESAPSVVLAVCGSIVAIATFAYTALLYRQPVMPAPTLPERCKGEGAPMELAATFYGQGRALFDAATTGLEYQRAADMFDCALAARPEFARAQYDRSRADTLIGQGDIDSSYTNFPTKARMPEIKDSYAQMIAALDQAGWSPTPRVLNSQGFNTLLAGITTGNLPLVDAAIKVLQHGLAAGGLARPDDTLDAAKIKSASASDFDVYRMLYTNLGVGRLARNDRPHAEQAYRAAINELRLAENRDLVASALSDLNTLEGHCTELYSATSGTCPQILAGIKDARRMLLAGHEGPAPGSGAARLTPIDAWARPARVGWSAYVSGFDPAKDTLSVVWSVFLPDWNVWRVVQPLFKAVDPKSLPTAGSVQRVTLYDNFPSFCLPAGKYRAEFYLNGVRVAGSDDLVVDVPPFRNYRSREMDVAFCAPDGWKLSSFRQNSEGRHLVRAFTNAQGKSAIYLFTFFTPKNPLDFETRSPIARAWSLLKRLTTSAPSDDTFLAAVSRFTSCKDPIPPATVLHREWTAPDGLVHVALVLGDSAPNGQACQVLESIGSYYERTDAQLLDQTP